MCIWYVGVGEKDKAQPKNMSDETIGTSMKLSGYLVAFSSIGLGHFHMEQKRVQAEQRNNLSPLRNSLAKDNTATTALFDCPSSRAMSSSMLASCKASELF